jgi:hypothetical protein
VPVSQDIDTAQVEVEAIRTSSSPSRSIVDCPILARWSGGGCKQAIDLFPHGKLLLEHAAHALGIDVIRGRKQAALIE